VGKLEILLEKVPPLKLAMGGGWIEFFFHFTYLLEVVCKTAASKSRLGIFNKFFSVGENFSKMTFFQNAVPPLQELLGKS